MTLRHHSNKKIRNVANAAYFIPVFCLTAGEGQKCQAFGAFIRSPGFHREVDLQTFRTHDSHRSMFRPH